MEHLVTQRQQRPLVCSWTGAYHRAVTVGLEMRSMRQMLEWLIAGGSGVSRRLREPSEGGTAAMEQFIGCDAHKKFSVFVAVNEKSQAGEALRVNHERPLYREFLLERQDLG